MNDGSNIVEDINDPLPLNYASPESEPKGNRVITIQLPASVLLVLLQIPWAIVTIMGAWLYREGRAKSIGLDTFVYAIDVVPAIGAIGFAVRDFSTSRRTKSGWASLISTLIAAILAAAVIAYVFSDWYVEIWLDPNGYWDIGS